MHISRPAGPVSGAGSVPKPSDANLIRLATIAAQVEKVLAPESSPDKPAVSLTTARNDRRRAMEAILVLLADAELRSYLAELERLGLLAVKRD
jgi:hypothetical protein